MYFYIIISRFYCNTYRGKKCGWHTQRSPKNNSQETVILCVELQQCLQMLLVSLFHSTVPSAPLDLEVLETTTVSIQVSWSSPTDDGGSSVTGYRVITQDLTNSAIVPRTTDTTTVFNITGLIPFRSYRIDVSAMNFIGFGSDASIFATTQSLSKLL